MSTPILATKLYSPPPRPEIVQYPRLVIRLNEGVHHKHTLISAPAGFGKTTLVNTWLTECPQPTAWVSLDDGAGRDHRPGPVLSVLQYRAPTSKSGLPPTPISYDER